MFFLLYRQNDIDKIIDVYSPKGKCDGSKFTVQQDDTLVTIILRNNTELNRALQ